MLMSCAGEPSELAALLDHDPRYYTLSVPLVQFGRMDASTWCDRRSWSRHHCSVRVVACSCHALVNLVNWLHCWIMIRDITPCRSHWCSLVTWRQVLGAIGGPGAAIIAALGLLHAHVMRW